jgi:hypothetical protein
MCLLWLRVSEDGMSNVFSPGELIGLFAGKADE